MTSFRDLLQQLVEDTRRHFEQYHPVDLPVLGACDFASVVALLHAQSEARFDSAELEPLMDNQPLPAATNDKLERTRRATALLERWQEWSEFVNSWRSTTEDIRKLLWFPASA